MAGFNDAPLVQSLAVPAVCMLIAFLGYFSQYIFYNSTLEPGPPTNDEIILFNALLLSLWYTYFKAVSVNPGFYEFPGKVIEADGNWCKKCAAPKPARAHHCRHCGRCIPKMDHHCPWTANCVSMNTFPHFLRFLVFANVSLWVLGTLLWQRLYALWEARNLPAYLGPTLQALIALALISLICAVTSLALGIMLITTVKGWLFNCTMIEGWQLERHEALTEQGDRDWWDMTDLDGKKIKFEKVEFPYDIGFFANMSQAMGTSNILLWFLPFSGNPTVSREGKGSGWDWEENGFNRKEGMWPPLDPEKIRRANRSWATERRDFDAELRDVHLSPEETKRAFKERQEQDARRRNLLVAELEEIDDYDLMDEKEDTGYSVGGTRWTNIEGERLSDYGVDDDSDRSSVDNVPDDDVPLADLLRRRKVAQATTAD